jgi:hypothetical protein
MGVRRFAFSVIGLLLLGCGRKAPSPETCVAFTELLLNTSHEQLLQDHPEYKARFDLIVVTCLTEPFDERVFKCTAETSRPYPCLESYGPKELRRRVNGTTGSRRPPW